MSRPVDVIVVGAGPAGATAATLLARAGREVVVLERSPTWRWRACGVFASPAAMARLRRLGLDTPGVRASARPIGGMQVEPRNGPAVRLTYGFERDGDPSAVGFDRSTLDPALVVEARRAGADVREGVTVSSVESARGGMTVRHRGGILSARVVVGADGIRSIVARSLGVARSARIPPRVGLTYHLTDPRADGQHDARLRVLRDGYVGLAPVRGRINVGIVLGASWRDELRRDGAASVAARIVRETPPTEDDPVSWRDGPPCEPLAGVSPIGHGVTRRAGPGWILVGDAGGFLDPFTGEGLHRALVTAELGATAVEAYLAGRPDALDEYARVARRRSVGKDLVTVVIQAFLTRPVVFEYATRRLASRSQVRETMGLVIGDLIPASRAIDPRFIAALLAP